MVEACRNLEIVARFSPLLLLLCFPFDGKNSTI
mgnify:FL=1